jgi:hypothetical protein
VCRTFTLLKIDRYVPPSHTHHGSTHWKNPGCSSVELVKGEPDTFRAPGLPHHTVRLLRKEVIQPHLPVRLPCYDFVPIASPTFDNSLPYGLGRRLRVLPTFVT